jgi:hypothetical protein
MKLTLTREQAEANWGWSAKDGSLWPKEWRNKRRIRCTDRNIMSQQFLARRGTLIHTAAKSTCPRKACKVDDKTEIYQTSAGEGRIGHIAEATFIDNVNCLWCRKDYFTKVNRTVGQRTEGEESNG